MKSANKYPNSNIASLAFCLTIWSERKRRTSSVAMTSVASKSTTGLVFIPFSSIGHLYSMVATAERMLDRDDRLSITILLMLPYGSDLTDFDRIATVATAARLQFHTIPKEDSFSELVSSGKVSMKDYLHLFIDHHKPLVRESVHKLIVSDYSVHLAGFVLDMMYTTLSDVAADLGVPSYIFFASSAACLGLSIHLERLRDHGELNPDVYKDPDAMLAVPCFVNPVPARLLPTMFHEESKDAMEFKQAKGVLVNTFAELEPRALESLSGNGPTIYPVGPILNLDGPLRHSDGRPILNLSSASAPGPTDIMSWLDRQPPKSVVFLCFGSLGSFSAEQVQEIARGLELAGQRFLWSLQLQERNQSLEEVLPQGFLDRTAEIGRVTGWTSQLAVLAHPAISGFVSHCGWNSTLESLWHGVPVATWPMYAEQQLNAFAMVKELGLAVELSLDYRQDLWNKTFSHVIGEEEIARAIERLMEEESEVKRKLVEMKTASRKAMVKGGSSYASLHRFIRDVITDL